MSQPALPASAATICAFLATEADTGVAAATLSRRLAAIRVVHQGNQQTSAHDASAVSEVMRGIRNRQKGRPSSKKAPLIDTDLTLLVGTLDMTTLAGARDRARLLVAAAALRRSELVHIDVEHLAFRPEGLTLTVLFSKTDQTGKGVQIAVPDIPLLRYCPGAALKAWLAVAGITEGAVFRRMRRGPRVGQDRLSDSTVDKLINAGSVISSAQILRELLDTTSQALPMRSGLGSGVLALEQSTTQFLTQVESIEGSIRHQLDLITSNIDSGVQPDESQTSLLAYWKRNGYPERILRDNHNLNVMSIELEGYRVQFLLTLGNLRGQVGVFLSGLCEVMATELPEQLASLTPELEVLASYELHSH